MLFVTAVGSVFLAFDATLYYGISLITIACVYCGVDGVVQRNQETQRQIDRIKKLTKQLPL